MIKLLYFHFPVTNLRLKNKKLHFELYTNLMGEVLISHFWAAKVNLANEKNPLLNTTVWMSVNP